MARKSRNRKGRDTSAAMIVASMTPVMCAWSYYAIITLLR